MAYTTNYTMLEKMCRGDEISWQEFYLRYAPFIAGIAQKWSFTQAECEEIVQLTMEEIFAKNALQNYQRDLGKFRRFLAGIVKNRLRNYCRARRKREREVPEETIEEAGVSDELFAGEYRNYLLQLMLDALRNRVENSTFEAFYLCTIEEHTPEETAALLQIPAARVYTAKSRCLRHLHDMAQKMQREDPGFAMPFAEE